ncbi:MAG: hypothetical protein AAF617_15480 [Bacteroidota bacterium]
MKKKSLLLKLKKTKIVSFATIAAVKGGVRTENCDDTNCSACDNTGTKDKPNTNNGVPTVGKPQTKETPVSPSISCDPCV